MLVSSPQFSRTAKRLLAFGSGLALFSVLALVTGVLAAVAIPHEYFAYFGREHTELALFLLNTLTIAMPIAAIGFIWSLATMRYVRLPAGEVATLCLSGYLIAFGFSFAQLIWFFLTLEADGKVPFSVFLRSGFTWWNAPTFVAVPLGIIAAATLRARSPRLAQ